MKLKRPAQKYPLVEVLWDDATHLELGWKTAEEFKAEALHPEIVMSVGFLIAETPDHVVIAMDVDKEGQHNQRGQIPRSMVKRMRVLRRVDKEPAKPEALLT